MKKITVMFLTLAILLSFAACGNSQATQATTSEAEKTTTETSSDVEEVEEAMSQTNNGIEYHAVYTKPSTLYKEGGGNKIGVTVLDSVIPHCQAWANGVASVIEANGDEAVILDPDFDAVTQANNIDDFVAQGCVGIVSETIDGEALVTVVQAACDAGIMVSSSDFQFGVGHDGLVCSQTMTPNEDAGEMLAEQMAKDLNYEKGSEIVILATPNLGAQQRADGFRTVCSKYEFNIVFDGDGGADVEVSNSVMNDQLQAHPNIAAVICQNDESAIGAYTAAETAGLADQVKCYGFDAAPEACDYISQGKETASLGQQPFEMGAQAAYDLYKAMRGEDIGDYIKWCPYKIITKDIVSERLDTYYTGDPEYKYE